MSSLDRTPLGLVLSFFSPPRHLPGQVQSKYSQSKASLTPKDIVARKRFLETASTANVPLRIGQLELSCLLDLVVIPEDLDHLRAEFDETKALAKEQIADPKEYRRLTEKLYSIEAEYGSLSSMMQAPPQFHRAISFLRRYASPLDSLDQAIAHLLVRSKTPLFDSLQRPLSALPQVPEDSPSLSPLIVLNDYKWVMLSLCSSGGNPSEILRRMEAVYQAIGDYTKPLSTSQDHHPNPNPNKNPPFSRFCKMMSDYYHNEASSLQM